MPKKKQPEPTPKLSPKVEKQIRLDAAKIERAANAKLALAAIPKPTDITRCNPSAVKTLRMCPSFFAAYEEEEDRGAANEGTLLHERCRTGDLKGLDVTQKPLVEMCLAYLKTLRTPGDQRTSEKKFNIIKISNGFIDELLVSKDLRNAHVVDWKFGFLAVDDAEVNDQGKCYVIAVFDTYPTLEETTVHFVQPRLDSITMHTFKRADVAALKTDLTSVYLQTKLPPNKRPHRVVPQACAKCGRVTVCPSVMKLFAETIPLADPEITAAEIKAFLKTDVEAITDGGRAEELFVASRVLNALCRTVKDQCTQFLLAGYAMTKVKLATRDGALSVTGRPDEIYQLVKKEFPECDAEQFYRLCSAPNKSTMDQFLEDLALATKGKGTRANVMDALAQGGYLSRGNPSFYAKLA